MSQETISFDATPEDRAKARKIARRANQLYRNNGVANSPLDIEMDLIATHANGCPLDFDKLAGFNDFNLLHDIDGIARHLDRETGQLRNFFDPRCSRPTTD